MLLGVAMLACGVALARPGSAHAAWPLERDASVVLGFGASYRTAEATTSSTHCGADLAATAGASVRAPLAGDVTFAGYVPGIGGGRVCAVTIATGVGSLTLLPLRSASVARGAHLSAGDDVGEVAAEGDGSSAETHLHVGLKRGELYLDPLGVLSPPAVSSGGGASAPQAAAAAERAGGATHVQVGASTGARTVWGTGVSAGAAVVPHATQVAVPGAQLAPGVSVGGAALAGAPAAGTAPVAVPTLSLPVPTTAASAGGPSLAPLVERAAGSARRSARGAMWALLGVLAALGALWPVWRRNPLEGLGKMGVSAGGDDVAAVSGR